jgi:hypothetical protein
MPGNTDRITMARIMHMTNGKEPTRILRSEMSGAMPLMT